MIFSMFARRSGCVSSVFTQQVKRLMTQSILEQKSVKIAPITSITLKNANTTSLLSSVRSFRTSSVRLSDEKPHDHSKLWVIEKATSALMVPLIPLALLMPNKIFDTAIAILITAHSFWGLEAIAVDYVRASVFGPVIPKIAIGLVYLFSIATLGGLLYIITHDVGIGNSVRQLWAIKSDGQKS